MSFFSKISIEAAEKEAMMSAIYRVIDKKSYYPMFGNPAVKGFERELSKMLGGNPVLGMNSGTSALIAALKVLGIGSGDEVIVPAFSFISTASPIMEVGATPVFVDIRLNDYAIDPSKIEEKITEHTKAIIVAHIFGQPALGISEILEIARKKSLPVIEDAAQSFGAKIKINNEYRLVGTLGDIGCFSFSSTKPISAPGNAGAIVFQKKDNLYDTADKMRTYGQRVTYRDYPVIGANNILQDIQAAALLARFKFLDHWLDHRRKLADYYTKQLCDIPDIVLPENTEGIERVWYRYSIRTPKRDALQEHLLRTAINEPHLFSISYPVPLPFFSVFKQEHKPGDFPISEKVASEIISLPIFNLTPMDVAVVVAKSVKEFFRK